MKFTIFALALFGGSIAEAQSNDSGNDLLSFCNAADSDQDQALKLGYCLGFVSGSWQGMKLGALSVASSVGGMNAEEMDVFINTLIGVCLPETVERGQMLDVFMLYLVEHPEVRHETARSLLHRSLQEAFPCV